MTSFVDRVRDTTQSTGTGSMVLDSIAPLGFQTFYDGVLVLGGLELFYCIVDETTGDWEVGRGSYDKGTNTLSRNTGTLAVYSSSNGNAAVSFVAGEKQVFCTLPSFILEPGRITVDDADPATFNNESKGYQPNRSLWINWSTGAFFVYDGDVSDNNGVWGPLKGYNNYRQDGSSAGIVLAGYSNADLTGAGKFATTTNGTLSGAKGRSHADYSHVFGHGWPAGETGYGAHQSEVQGINCMTTDATPTEITSRLYLQERGAGLFRVQIVAFSDGNDYKAWSGEVLIWRGFGMAPTINTNTLAAVGASAGAASWTVTLAAGTATGLDGIKATVTGAAATTIHWTVAAFATVAHNSSYT